MSLTRPMQYLLAALLCCACATLQAANAAQTNTTPDTVMLLTDPYQRHTVQGELIYLTNLDDTLSAEQVLALFQQGQGTRLTTASPTFGFSEAPHWFYLQVKNTASGTLQQAYRDWVLKAGLPHTDHVSLYLFDQEKRLATLHTGEQVPVDARPFLHHHLLFPVTLEPNTVYHILLRAQTRGALEWPVSLQTLSGFAEDDATGLLITGLFFGIVLALILYNLMIYSGLKDPSYFYYALYFFSFACIIALQEGLLIRYFWPEQIWFNRAIHPVALLLTLGFNLRFVMHFLRLDEGMPRIANGIHNLSLGLILIAPFTVLSDSSLIIRSAVFLVFPATLLTLLLGIWRWRQGYRPALFLLAAVSLVLLSAVLYSLKTFGIFDSHPLIEHSTRIAMTLEALLLSYALAYRFRVIEKENTYHRQQATEALEKSVQQRTRELHAALNARSEFLTIMSHEIRTPLSSILGMVDLLRQEGLSPAQQEKIHIVERSGQTLLDLIDDILDFSKLEAEQIQLQSSAFSIRQVLRDTASLFEQQARQKGNTIEVATDDSIQQPCCGDATRIRQILMNLVSNAVKFTEKGRIRLSAQRDAKNPDYVVVEVHDSGIGITPEKAAKIFDFMQHADAIPQRKQGENGLGLAISKRLVELMGGEIGVRSTPQKGACFWFRLPLLPVNSAQAPCALADPSSAQADATDTPGVPPSRILIVDDNPVNLLVTEGLCKKLGHRVESADTGMTAIATLLSDQAGFDFVLMDCEMPGMDGFDTTREIHKLQRDGRIAPIPVIALTAHAIPEKIQACLEAGMIGHIAKPVTQSKLQQALARILASA